MKKMTSKASHITVALLPSLNPWRSLGVPLASSSRPLLVRKVPDALFGDERFQGGCLLPDSIPSSVQ